MDSLYRYNKLNEYYKNTFGERVLKICVNGHFTCPNRDGTLSHSGCVFCSEYGSGEHLNPYKDISEQVEDYFKSPRANRANKFIVYFQNFSNTYDSLDNLKRKYDSALVDTKIIGLSVATRPDCINEDVVKLLHSYTRRYYVSVELGLQTSNEEIGKFINRQYTNEQFSKAVGLLNKYNIDVITHIMVGLPHETFEDIKSTVNFLNLHHIKGLKIHNTYVVKNTVLADMYKRKDYKPISLDYYLDCLTYIISHISPDIVIHRISGDAPKDLLIAPKWDLHKKWILNGLDKKLKEENLYQGIFLGKVGTDSFFPF